MARRCDICGKKAVIGHNVSYSKRRTPRWFIPNLRWVELNFGGKATKVKICMKCLKRAKKEGRVVSRKYKQSFSSNKQSFSSNKVASIKSTVNSLQATAETEKLEEVKVVPPAHHQLEPKATVGGKKRGRQKNLEVKK